MITVVTLPDEEADNLFNCTESRENHYLEYRESRIIDKSKSLFGTISLKSRTKKKKSIQKRC